MVKWIVRIGLGLMALAGLAAAGWTVAIAQPAVQDRMIAQTLQSNFAQRGPAAQALMADDALKVILCGTSAPMPDPKRAKSCTAIIAGGKLYIVDTGPEAWKNLAQWGIPGDRIGGVFLTHFHSDHIGELGEFNLQTWIAGRPSTLPVYGSQGVERVVAGFNEAYALDQVYRNAHHGDEIAPLAAAQMVAKPFTLGTETLPREQRQHDGSVVILEENGLKVTAFEVIHEPIFPAVGYRFDYKGRSVVISGDTTSSPNLVKFATGADLFLCEAQDQELRATIAAAAGGAGQARIAKIFADIEDYHVDPVDVARMANEAGVKLMVMHHIAPAVTNPITERFFLRGVAEVRPASDWLLGEDGMRFDLPFNSTEIVRGKMGQ